MKKNNEKIRQTFGGTGNLHYLCPKNIKYEIYEQRNTVKRRTAT